MATYTAKGWHEDSYTTSTWTTLVTATNAVIIKTLCASCGTNAAEVKFRRVNSGDTLLSTTIPSHDLSANTAYKVDAMPIVLNAGDKLQFWCDVAGVEFSADGAEADA